MADFAHNLQLHHLGLYQAMLVLVLLCNVSELSVEAH